MCKVSNLSKKLFEGFQNLYKLQSYGSVDSGTLQWFFIFILDVFPLLYMLPGTLCNLSEIFSVLREGCISLS